MEHDITTTVLNVQQIPSRDGQSIRHEVSLAGGVAVDGTQYPAGNFVTFDPGLSARAFQLVNQNCDARVEIVQKPKQRGSGFFTNFVLHDIAYPGMLPPMAMPAPGGTPAQQYVPTPQPPMQPATPQPPMMQPATPQPMAPAAPQPAPPVQIHPALAAEEERKSEERRRSAMHAAFEFVARISEGAEYETALAVAQTLTDDLVRYVASGSWNGQTPEEIAAEANQALGEGAVQVGVPFDAPEEPSE